MRRFSRDAGSWSIDAGSPSSEPFILMQGTDILESAGFRCHEAMDGEEALEFLQERHESVVLLFSDVDLGKGINGFALARYVDENWPHIAIVIASGHVLPDGA